MPRTNSIESPGAPPFRALTFDSLGLIKVIEARDKERGVARVVDRWGDPESSRCVLAASMNVWETDRLLAVARKNGDIEILNPLNGNIHAAFSISGDNGVQPEDDAITGLHLFKKQKMDQTARSCTLLTCTTIGNASLRSINFVDPDADSPTVATPNTWKVCGSGSVICAKVDGNEKYALFGGKGVEIKLWDLDQCTKIWTAKPPPKNSLGIFSPTWFTSATFLSKDDHRKFVAGTNSHQVRVYDISAQRRAVLSFDFRETTIKSIAEDHDGHTIYVGNGSGDLASYDIRTGKLLGCFLGKCSGSIRAIARHPHQPVIASCGLDSYLRIWDVKSRQLLSAVFLKQHLTGVVFDPSFEGEDTKQSVAEAAVQEERIENEDSYDEDEIETLPVKRKKSREQGSKKRASVDIVGSKKLKSKKKSKKVKHKGSEED